MTRAACAGVAYFASMFALGFVLGTIRVLLLEPRIGPWLASSVELPVMLLASWFVCAWLLRRLAVAGSASARLLMGIVAFTVLIIAEILLGMTLFGRTISAQAGNMTSGPGLLGLAGQLAFASFPIVQMKRGRGQR